MKILMVSMPSLHFFRWTEQLKDAGHDIYWFNITDSGEFVERMGWINQCYGWRLKWDFPGRIRLKSLFPKLTKFIEKFNINATDKAFEKYLNQVKPDVVHSFALHISCTPILPVMSKYKNVKWIYSSWGSDLYARIKESCTSHLAPVLERVDYLFTDCHRDFIIAKEYGFKGEYLGRFPGGGGYSIDFNQKDLQLKQKQIIIKGYENKHGKCIFILDQLRKVTGIESFHILIFGATQEVINYVKKSLKSISNVTVYTNIPHHDLIEHFKKSKIYIGYSLSDGTPNTMLEALLSGCIVLQSNPGNVTQEWITDGVNGFILTENNITFQIEKALNFTFNQGFIDKMNHYKELLDRTKVTKLIIKKYNSV